MTVAELIGCLRVAEDEPVDPQATVHLASVNGNYEILSIYNSDYGDTLWIDIERS